MLVTSIFSFSHNVFERLLPQGCLKLTAIAHDKINVNEKLKFDMGRVENIVGKGENADYQRFLLFSQCFQKASSSGSLKVGIVW